MKKIITIVTLLTCFAVFSQGEVAKKVNELIARKATFKTYSVLTEKEHSSSESADKILKKATYATINPQAIAELIASKNENIEVEIPYQGQIITVQLYKVNIFSEGFHVDTNKSKDISYQQGVYYRGIIKGDSKSTASFNFFKNELNGVLSNGALNNLVIGKLDKKQNVSDYIIYSDGDLTIENNFECHAKDNIIQKSNKVKRSITQTQSARCVTMYFEIDNDLFVANGSDTTTTTNWMTSVFNNVQTLYANDGITVSLKSLYIWTTPDSYTGTTSTDYLYQFNSVRPVFDGDVGQLVSIDPGGMGGVAITINGLCSQDNFSYSDVYFSYNTVPTYSWTIQVITHEFGHLLGSPHTHACVWNGNNTPIDNCGPSAIGSTGEGYSCMTSPPTIPSASVKGTIMSYCHLVSGVGISLANGFGPQPKAAILDAINSGICLSTDCINTCINTVSEITVSNTTNSSATISWVDSGNASSWEIAVTPFNATTQNWTKVLTNSFFVSGLSSDTFYRISVRPICSGGLTSLGREYVLVTNTNFCDGVVITDSGGTLYDYTNSETYVRTIIPNVANKKIDLSFSSFNLEKDYDYLYVYDGNSTTATDLSAGGFTGTTIPGPFESTAADGSLTIKFSSDGGVVAAGYVAIVACVSNLSNTQFVPNIDFTYYPNPSTGLVSITSKTQMDEVFVYNPEGQLLYHNKINGLETKVNMTSFATGTYFFKLKFNEKEANFKILKM